jgi:hypothetical protein
VSFGLVVSFSYCGYHVFWTCYVFLLLRFSVSSGLVMSFSNCGYCVLWPCYVFRLLRISVSFGLVMSFSYCGYLEFCGLVVLFVLLRISMNLLQTAWKHMAKHRAPQWKEFSGFGRRLVSADA